MKINVSWNHATRGRGFLLLWLIIVKEPFNDMGFVLGAGNGHSVQS